ncbi:MAG: glycosyltransferase family 2 protein [Chitinophagaceae bacterium]|nr:glycosyltransferase family 2 protein [Chitinophagaceae bacterium]
MPRISVIVPVYNAAAYIEQCIHSVLNQTMKDVEVIAVNDGSTDNSAALLDAMAAANCRLRVFHSSNKGVSATRNFGMQQAQGEWIGFADADDFMAPAMLEELYNAVVMNGCNWAICNVQVQNEQGAVRTRLKIADAVIDAAADRPAFVHSLMRFQYDNANWNKLFNAAILQKEGLQFNTAMHLWEDLLFNLQYLHFAGKVATIAKPLYHYRILSQSIQSGSFVKKTEQFNCLYNSYLQFTRSYAAQAEGTAFQTEMSRIVYNQLLYEAEVNVLSHHRFFLKAAVSYRKYLQQFVPAVFTYSPAERRGLRGIKKQLLHKQYYTLFALTVAVKPWLKKPYLLIRRLLKK